MSHKSKVSAGTAPSAISAALAVWLQGEGTPRLLSAPSFHQTTGPGNPKCYPETIARFISHSNSSSFLSRYLRESLKAHGKQIHWN